jgi:Ca2+/Na+ antiporter
MKFNLPVPMFLGVYLLFLIISWKKKRSWYTMLEVSTVIVLLVYSGKMFFLVYYCSKMLTSLIYFLFKISFLNHYKNEKRLYFKLGFSSGWFHAGVLVNERFYHYAFAEKGDETDNISKHLSPQDMTNIPNCLINLFSGWHIKVLDKEIKRILAACGKCHNYAVMLIYHLSYDKFLSYSLLTIFRWEMWILISMLLFSYPVKYMLLWECWNDEMYYYDLKRYNRIIELFTIISFDLIMILDCMNLSSPKLHANVEERKKDPKVFRILDFCMFVLLEFCLIVYSFSEVTLHSHFLIFLISFFSIFFSLIFWRVDKRVNKNKKII